MSWLCRMGWHKWVFTDTRTPSGTVTSGKCTRKSCCRYPDWRFVTLEPNPWD